MDKIVKKRPEKPIWKNYLLVTHSKRGEAKGLKLFQSNIHKNFIKPSKVVKSLFKLVLNEIESWAPILNLIVLGTQVYLT